MDVINNFKKIVGNKNNLILIIVLLVILLIAINYIFNEKEKIDNIDNKDVSNKRQDTSINTNDIESKLEKIICSIEGVNQANVMVAFSTTDKVIPVYDTKENVDTIKEENKTSTKTTTEKTVAYEDYGSSKSVIIESKQNAIPTGAIVVVKGNITDTVESEIKQAVSMVTNVALHKIQLFVN